MAVRTKAEIAAELLPLVKEAVARAMIDGDNPTDASVERNVVEVLGGAASGIKTTIVKEARALAEADLPAIRAAAAAVEAATPKELRILEWTGIEAGHLVVGLYNKDGGLVDCDDTVSLTLERLCYAAPANALLGPTEADAVGGLATFDGLSVSEPGRRYFITAYSGGLRAITPPFNVE